MVAKIIPSCSGRLLRMGPYYCGSPCLRITDPPTHPTLTLIDFRIYVGENCEVISSKTAFKVHLRRQEIQLLTIQYHVCPIPHLFLGPSSPCSPCSITNPPSTSVMFCHLLSPSHSLVIRLTSMCPMLPHLPHHRVQSLSIVQPHPLSLVPQRLGFFLFYSPLSQ